MGLSNYKVLTPTDPHTRIYLMKRIVDNTPRKCDRCHKTFVPSSRHIRCPMCRTELAKHPCIVCGKKIKRNHTKCISCHNRTLPGAKPRPGSKHYKHGYVYIHTPRGWMFEHQYVMSEFIGRPLVEGEKVHHINGIKDDNRLENLQLWTKPHPSGIRALDALAWARTTIKLYGPIEHKLE